MWVMYSGTPVPGGLEGESSAAKVNTEVAFKTLRHRPRQTGASAGLTGLLS
jgi:hypothetical protein